MTCVLVSGVSLAEGNDRGWREERERETHDGVRERAGSDARDYFLELVGVDADAVEGAWAGEAVVGFGGEVGWVASGK